MRLGQALGNGVGNGLKTAFLLALVSLVGVIPMGVGLLDANLTYMAAFTSTYPGTTGSDLDSCTTCHTTIPGLNPYGQDYQAAGHSFAAIESMDSDGDGFTNIDEIVALTFPGDPSSFPDEGGGPGEEETVITREIVDIARDYGVLAAATDTRRHQYLVGWTGSGAVGRFRSDGRIRGRLVDDEGIPTRVARALSTVDAASTERLGLAFGRNDFALAYVDTDGALWTRRIKGDNGVAPGPEFKIADNASRPALTSDNVVGFMLAYTTDSGWLQNLDGKARPVGLPGSLATLHRSGDLASVPHLGGIRSFGAEANGSKRRPVSYLVDSDFTALIGPDTLSSFRRDSSLYVVGDAQPTGASAAAWQERSKSYATVLAANGNVTAPAARLGGQKTAAPVVVAMTVAGEYMVAWVDTEAGAVMAQVWGVTGPTDDPFRVSAAGETVSSTSLAAAYDARSDRTLIVYSTTGFIPRLVAALVEFVQVEP